MGNTSIVVCGDKIDIGTRVVLWNESNGLNGYNTSAVFEQDRKTGKINTISGKRYSSRAVFAMSRKKLEGIINQFFLHHSGLYRSKDTFNVLHNERKLSVHFILDDDGTLYQTLDLAEKAWHGGGNNPQSVGIEIDSKALAGKYPSAYDVIHQQQHGVGSRRKRLDKINGAWIMGFEYTDAQYEALIRLAIGLKKTFPKIGRDFPRTASGMVIKSELSKPLDHFGFICHYNNNSGKIDPIAFDHERFLRGVNNNNPKEKSSFQDTTAWDTRQLWLKTLGYQVGAVDGIYGPKTKQAVKDFQNDRDLQPDGKWGPQTEYMLEVAISETRHKR